KNTDRPEFVRLMRAITPGDTIVVSRLDRLVRSSRDLANVMHELDENGCGFVSLGESWCDTTTDVGRLVMTIMGGIAEFERSLIRKRCDEGIERAPKGAGGQQVHASGPNRDRTRDQRYGAPGIQGQTRQGVRLLRICGEIPGSGRRQPSEKNWNGKFSRICSRS